MILEIGWVLKKIRIPAEFLHEVNVMCYSHSFSRKELKNMKSLFVTILVGLSFELNGVAVQALERPTFLIQPAPGTVIVKDSDYGTFIIRKEVSVDGSITEKSFIMDSNANPTKWVLDTTRTFLPLPSVTADTVARLSNPEWLTDEEKLQFGDSAKPRVIVEDNPACDSGESTIKLLNKKSGEFKLLYKFTSECGEILFVEIDNRLYFSGILTMFKLVDIIGGLQP